MDLCLAFDETFDLCLNSYKQIKCSYIKKKNLNSGIIIMKAPDVYSAPFGNIIKFKLTRKTDNISYIIVECYPTIKTSLIDNGVNLKNMETIIKYLKKVQN